MAENKAKAASKTVTYQELANSTGMSKKDVAKFFDALTELIKREIGKKGPGIFTIPGLLKIKRVNKPATKARQGRNPKTGEPMTIPAKKARTIVKAQALKGLKEMVL